MGTFRLQVITVQHKNGIKIKTVNKHYIEIHSEFTLHYITLTSLLYWNGNIQITNNQQ